mmetsp:Transcript_68721/g.183092  ORF Transcript_68721/g.183092 Transcript_68721/m.183092 type:complete len:122 (-) Transcript_68721:64-429(-)
MGPSRVLVLLFTIHIAQDVIGTGGEVTLSCLPVSKEKCPDPTDIDNTEVCCGHGDCTLQGVCICHEWWYGAACEKSMARAVSFKEGDVTSGGMAAIVVVSLLMIFGGTYTMLLLLNAKFPG